MNKQDDEYICVDREHGLWKRKEPKDNVNADRLALALSLETIRGLEAENAALRIVQKQDKENYQIAMKASMDFEERLKSENTALREELKEANRLLHVWSPESVQARKEAQP